MAPSIQSILISFPRVLIDPVMDHVNVHVDTDQGSTDFPLSLTDEMRAKPFQVANIEGEFLYDLVQQINATINPPVEE